MRIGIDLGGTKIAGILLDDSDKTVVEEAVATPRYDYQGVMNAISSMVSRLSASTTQPCTIGIGVPGSVSPVTGLIQNANSTWINSKPFHKDLETALARPVRLANDADCLAMSEAHDGSAAGAASVFGIILGTGCGGGLVIDGRLFAGKHNIAGEWGHNPLPWPEEHELPGPKCWCGRNGCLETWISGPGLAADHQRHTGDQLTGEDVSSLALSGNKAAIETLHRHLHRTARGLAHVINLFDPQILVIGGGLVHLPDLVERLPEAVSPFVFADKVEIDIRRALHGPASGVRGAARLWSNEESIL